MIMELATGLGAAAVSFGLLLALCVALGKIAGYFSNYKNQQQ